jgi:hypothetical protein
MSILVTIIPIVLGPAIAPVVLAAEVVDLITNPEQEHMRNVFDFPTEIRNKDLLHEALAKMGTRNISSFQKSVAGRLDDLYIICDRKTVNQPFIIRVGGKIKPEEAIHLKDELIAEYGRTVQNYVYETLKRKAEEKGLILEKEVLQDDQSVVLTYNIN